VFVITQFPFGKLTEDEASFILREILIQAQQDLQRRLAPFIAELSHLELRKPQKPIQLPDGRVFTYTGPTATELGAPYQPPSWLNELVSSDPLLGNALQRYRRHHEEHNE
jgi:hypothetical protein